MEINNRARNKDADRLSELLQEPHQNHRHNIWLWLFLYYYREARLDLRTCNGLTMRDEIARALRSQRFFQSRIPRQKDRFLLPNEKLDWIEEDERQHRWLIREIEQMTDLRLHRSLVHLTGRDRLIAMVDL